MSTVNRPIRSTRIILYTILVVLVLVWLFPVFFIANTALRSNPDIMTRGFFALPQSIQWGNFVEAWTVGNMSVYILNSVYVSSISSVGTTFLALLLAFAISRMNFKFGRSIYLAMLILMMVPATTVIIPQVMVLNAFHLLNTRTGMILSCVTGGIPFFTFLMYGYMKSVPMEIDESAVMDGCGDFRRFITLIAPLCGPIIATVCILNFLADWNDYIFSLVILRTESIKTLALGLINYSNRYGTKFHLQSMGILIATIPVTIVYLSLQRYFVAGLTTGAVKS